MLKNRIAILGIPIDNLDLDEVVGEIFAMIDTYENDRRSRQVATVNVDFIVNTLSWRSERSAHPELLDILRRADLVTPDGMPVVWAGKLLGSPLKERVTGADLVPRLAEMAGKRQKTIYFLGGRGDVGKRAAALLESRYPGFIAAGADSPFVHVEGEALIDTEKEDRAIVARINASRADILLIGFGNPKQEIWFDRNRDRLKVPVSIGIGGTYEFIVGSVTRAPEWIQKTGLEWIFRITQDPLRLWKRYFVGFFKFGLIMLPAIFYYRATRLWFDVFHKKKLGAGVEVDATHKNLSESINMITLPELLDASIVQSVKEGIDKQISRYSVTVLDFKQVKFMDSSGLGMLISLWRKAEGEKRKLFMIGIKSLILGIFRLNRIYDLFKEKIFTDISDITKHLQENTDTAGFSYIRSAKPGMGTYYLAGTLDAGQMAHLDSESLVDEIGSRDCIINLKNLRFVDSSGIMLFLKIQRNATKQGKQCVLCSVQANVLKIFRITKLIRLFKIAKDTHAAEKMISH